MVEGPGSNPPSPITGVPIAETVISDAELEGYEDVEAIPDLRDVNDNESDVDPRLDDPDAVSEATEDTTGAVQPGDVGMQLFDDSRCLCRMTVKSGGRTLLCGYPANACNRKGHPTKRRSPDNVGIPGVYLATWNSNKRVLNAVEDTYLSPTQWSTQRALNRQVMEEMAVSQSTNKAQLGESVRTRAPPAVHLNLVPEILGPSLGSDTPRTDLMKQWGDALTPLPLKPGAKQPPQSEPSVSFLLSTLIDKFDDLQAGLKGALERNHEGLVAELQKRPPQPLPLTTTRTCTASPPPLSDVAFPMGQTKKKSTNRFYAVAIRRQTGVFTNWRTVRKSVAGFPGAVHKRFRHEDDARAWLAEKLSPDKYLTGDDDNNTYATRYEPETGAAHPISPGDPDESQPMMGRSQPMDRIVDVNTIGPNVSMGKSKELYGTSIQVEPEVLKILCPKGVTAPVQKELMDSTVNVCSLPGKYNASNLNNDRNIIMDQFAEAVGDLTEMSSRRAGDSRLNQDTQWRMSGKNALEKVKTVEDLNGATEEISSMRGTVLSNMESAFREVLYNNGWTTNDADLWITAGLLPKIIRHTMQWWLELHVSLQTISNANPEHWDEVVLPRISYHSKCLARIRKWSLTRCMMILQVYIYLRDMSAKSFQDICLIADLTTKLQQTALQSHPSSQPKPPPWGCAHCHSDLHEGGKNACPMKDLKSKVARRIAKESERAIKTDPQALHKAVAAEKLQPTE
jgi:hypothetical protein